MALTKIEASNIAAGAVASSGLIGYTVYTSGDTWSKSTNSPTKVIVEVVGGGGGSGSGAGNWGFGGGGGLKNDSIIPSLHENPISCNVFLNVNRFSDSNVFEFIQPVAAPGYIEPLQSLDFEICAGCDAGGSGSSYTRHGSILT